MVRGRVQHPYISSFLGFYDLRVHASLLTYKDNSWCVLKFYFRPNPKLSFEFFGKLIILRICLAVLELIIHIPFKNNGKKKRNNTTFCLGKNWLISQFIDTFVGCIWKCISVNIYQIKLDYTRLANRIPGTKSTDVSTPMVDSKLSIFGLTLDCGPEWGRRAGVWYSMVYFWAILV